MIAVQADTTTYLSQYRFGYLHCILCLWWFMLFWKRQRSCVHPVSVNRWCNLFCFSPIFGGQQRWDSSWQFCVVWSTCMSWYVRWCKRERNTHANTDWLAGRDRNRDKCSNICILLNSFKKYITLNWEQNGELTKIPCV